ncbi:baseplate J/gp47 family protein [Martelella alba]|uniref:Baseplate J/gp47 family protein n=1 Tax=Martelella alba TaxID=2590451 RepID=A0ABY2SR53_9HYPH|nr:baseplate J/gp47 family protein [Martelella alba]TKI08671.1 baseplate J/gp47 family protein [Martelella alba]
MPYITPTFDDIRSDFLRDISNQLPSADTGVDSDYYVRASALASLAIGIYQYQGWIVRQIFPDTADTEYLEWHARTRNLFRKSATTANGNITVTGEPGASADAGLIITRGDLSYTTTAAVTLDNGGNGTVAANYSTAGAAGNTTAVASGTFNSTPTGFDSTVAIGIMSGGTDKESDTELLARLLDIIRRAPAGGNQYDYRRWAMSVDGVTAAYVYPLRRGLGTVDVVITSASGLPSDDIIAATQAYIDDVRPVTAKNCLVLGPTIKAVDLEIQVSLDGVTLDAATTAIISALDDYINKLPPGDPFIRSQAEALVSNITGVVDRVIVTPTGNVSPTVNDTVVEWIRAGNITVSQL